MSNDLALRNGQQNALVTQPVASAPLQLNTLDDFMRLGKVFAESGYFSDAKGAAQAVTKIIMGRELGIEPMQAMTGIHVIEGKPSVGAHIMAARIKSSHKYDYRVNESTNDVCDISYFENGQEAGRLVVTMKEMDDAKVSMSWNKDNRQWQRKKNWQAFGSDMLFARNISRGLRRYCPDVFSQPVYTPEELDVVVDVEGNVVEAAPLSATAPVATESTPANGAPTYKTQNGDGVRHQCKCGNWARYGRSQSGAGWVCASGQCDFKLKDESYAPPEESAEEHDRALKALWAAASEKKLDSSNAAKTARMEATNLWLSMSGLPPVASWGELSVSLKCELRRAINVGVVTWDAAKSESKPKNLNQAVKEKHAAAMVDNDPDGSALFEEVADEFEPIRGDAYEPGSHEPDDEIEEAQVVEEMPTEAPGEVPELVQDFIMEASKKGLKTESILNNDAVLSAANDYLKTIKRKPLDSLLNMSAQVQSLLVTAIMTDKLKW